MVTALFEQGGGEVYVSITRDNQGLKMRKSFLIFCPPKQKSCTHICCLQKVLLHLLAVGPRHSQHDFLGLQNAAPRDQPSRRLREGSGGTERTIRTEKLILNLVIDFKFWYHFSLIFFFNTIHLSRSIKITDNLTF